MNVFGKWIFRRSLYCHAQTRLINLCTDRLSPARRGSGKLRRWIFLWRFFAPTATGKTTPLKDAISAGRRLRMVVNTTSQAAPRGEVGRCGLGFPDNEDGRLG